MKTYLLNQNGETVMKEKKTRTFSQKSSLENKISQRKLSILARKQAELSKQYSTYKPKNNVVNVSTVSLVQNEKTATLPRITPKPFNSEKLKKEIKKTEYNLLNGGGKKDSKNTDELQRKLFAKICKVINIFGQPHGKSIPFDTLNDPYVIKELFSYQDKLREAFPSSKLTSLHKNAIKKQSFPGVNIVRQLFKEMGFKLKPINISEGYLGNKKLLKREYLIKKA